jgi:hypothetical protein
MKKIFSQDDEALYPNALPLSHVIKYKDGVRISFRLDEILSNIEIGCEISEISDGNELYLGALSSKALIYIGIEIANNVYNDQLHESEGSTVKDIQDCLSLCKKWFNDTSSVSLPEFNQAITRMNGTSCHYSKYSEANAEERLRDIIGSVARACFQYEECEENKDYKLSGLIDRYAFIQHRIEDVIDFLHACYKVPDEKAPDEKNIFTEKVRWGKFIIDFFKSGKHLFMV